MPFISFSDTSYRSLSIVTPNNPSNIILPFFFFRNTQKSITLEENIKELGVGAFACSSLETIVLNNKIEIIPPYCFYNCINLTNISNFCCSTISEYSFCDCKKLNTISSYAFESSSLNLSIIDAEYIWDYTFSNTKIRYVTFTDNVLFVGFKAFYNTVIYQLNLGQSLIKFPSYIFSNSNITEYSIPNNIKYIEEGCFCGCKNLTTIRNLINVDYIGDRAFEGCTSLTLSNGLYYIGFDAFSNCNLVTSMKISNHIQTIKTGTFFNCTSLSYFLFPESLISIEDEAFYNCISLEITRLPPSVSFIGTMAFGNCKIFQYHSICNSNVKFEFDAFSNSFIEIINISSEYIFINSYAISNCPFLHTVIIDANNGIIEHSAFYNCPNLTFIDFKSSKLTLCSYCFFNLNISSFTFPSGCISEPSVFKNCTKLKTITFQSNQRFSHYLDSILHIPGLEKIYFDDNTWSSYLSDDDCETLKGVELYYTGQEKTDENFDDLFAYSIYKNRLKVHVPYTYILDTFCDVEVIRERETNGRLMLENMVFCYQNSRINEPTVLHVSRTLSIFSQNLINALKS
ncbi:surface antigen BspA-like [Trichomonas vaginalis G3]|uniref:Surface antigen BspA-like n=1 Tax=Trichomonas vaginalis (strain ATCC PRA-98 / G3) TaxID=412133 RepID=A2DN18_TRIV3|nr:ribonuclease inhibitor domain-containing protein [Trichomonas vaginalis G3]EAY18195.1 surface antigen BspA-like [Trichomonas vaginalis G3]KAI5491490.1 ribonuclease inhibitor domain-containing protein [Trichomonas vaginalis G3]|eukprot:XP_001579181.1 surface antigen BspA-like [Trichomonas vaginalis G3]